MEPVHIIRSDDRDPITRCGLNWAINLIGAVPARKVEEYRARGERICEKCEAAS